MTSTPEVETTIAAIYRAATGTTTWPSVLRRIARDAGADAAQILGINPGNGAVLFSHASEGAAPAALDYVRTLYVHDPRVPRVLARPPGKWIFARRGFGDRAASGFSRRGGALLKLAQGRDEIVVAIVHAAADAGPFSIPQRDALARLGVHLREALPIYRRQRRVADNGALGAKLIGRTSRAMALIDSDRRVCATNGAFDTVLAERRLFELVAGVLQCQEATIEKSLTLAMMDLSVAPEACDRTRVVPLGASRGSVFAVSVTMLPEPESQSEIAGDPLVLLTAHQRPGVEAVDTSAWQAAFRLSPAEAKVAAHIFEGRATKEIARVLCVSPSTVKTQLDSIFAKTATTRQAELVGVLSTLSR